MADEPRFRSWAEQRSYRQIATELIRLEVDRAVLDFAALSEDPEGALHGHPEVIVEYDTNPKTGCSVFGYYRNQPSGQSVIFVHPALTSERDSFTILHELGHHVQRQHVEWANVRYSLSAAAGSKLEERVADAFAAEVLMPANTVAAGPGWLSAETLSDVHARVRASRAAVAMRAIEIAPENEQAAVVVLDLSGIVTFARALGDDVFAPARGRSQPGIDKLIAIALNSGGTASGPLTDGLQASSGWAQGALTVEVAVDHVGAYAFAVIRPAQRFGRSPVWDRIEDAECPSEACGNVFSIDATIAICDTCKIPKCPNCARCACEPKSAPVCQNCWLELNAAEQANPALHEC